MVKVENNTFVNIKCHSHRNTPLYLLANTDRSNEHNTMFKLIQNVHILNGIKNTRLAGNVLACRSFSDEAPRMEKSKFEEKRQCEKFEVNFVSNQFTAINSVQLLGRVGADPQRRGSEEHPVVTFTVATHNNYK